MREKVFVRHFQVRVDEELAGRLGVMAYRHRVTISELLREGAEHVVAREKADLLRQKFMDDLAAQVTPWLHEELRAKGIEDPEKYEVRYE